MKAKSFKKFVEEKEGPKTPYIDALEDELGIDAQDLEKEPQMASFFSLGKDIKNLGPYRIIGIKRDEEGNPTHAVVKTIEGKTINDRRYRDDGDKIKRIGWDAEEKTFIVPIDDLDKLLSQDFQPPPQAGGMP